MSDYLLSGLKVLDVATVIAGPVASMILADFGAEVIKIEQPPEGDMLRKISFMPNTPDADNNYFWQMDARNKKSISLDLKSEKGMEVMHRLIADCDIYITNQPFPVRRSLKLNYEDVKPLNPQIIYASLSAYGEKGPEKDGKGFDQIAYWARSGLMDLMREEGTTPSQALPGMGDHPTGVALYASIVTALLHREKTGEGSMVHTSLLANGLWSAASIAQGVFAGGDMPGYQQRRKIPLVMSNVYKTRDDQFILINMVRSRIEVENMYRILELPGVMDDARFVTPEGRVQYRGVLGKLIQDKLIQKDASEWQKLFADRVSIHVVAHVEEILQDPQMIANDMVEPPVSDDVDTPMIVNHPVNVDRVKKVGHNRAPDLGEHNEEILTSLGYSPEEIRIMRDESVI